MPTAPRALCTTPYCPHLQPCPDHQRPPWQGSTRESRLPPGWKKTRARILARDHHICHVCHLPGADEVDHLQAGDDHRDHNLAAIHAIPCHRIKSSAEGHAARRGR